MLNSFLKFGLLFLILLATTSFYGQLQVPFKVRYQSYIKGDMTVIANNIVNRKEYSFSPNHSYMNTTRTAKLNDEFEMFYIDIDQDKSTFSSSSATLSLKNIDNKKIVYAGLYWSATYKYNSGVQNKPNKFKAIDKNRETFDQIKLKLPGKMSYIDVKGSLIFDGLDSKGFNESAPYAVYADITNLVKELEMPTGEYTVANVKATQGQIEGGVSGGWTIFFVYEDEDESGKFITSFDGFAGVTDKATDISFSGFKTLPEGNVLAKLACAGLEGDNNLAGDQLQIKSQSSEVFTLLSSSLKLENNFFNSNIVVNDQFFNDRNPNSKNTLGYDTALITIANHENSVIQNNTDNVTLKLKTVGDRYFMFFNAFNVEVQEPEKKLDIIVENNKNGVDSENKKDIIILNKQNEQIAPQKGLIVDKVNETPEATKTVVLVQNEDDVINTQTKIENNVIAITPNTTITDPAVISKKLGQASQMQKKIAIAGPLVEIDNQQSGFYLIANVFAVHRNATRFVTKLRSLGIDANFFINPKNNYRYVFVCKSDTWSSALNLYYSNVNGKYSGDTWIMLVNTTPDQLISNEKIENKNNLFYP